MRESIGSRLRIIVPAYNEAARIGATLREYCSYFGADAAIVVVANGCTDDTVGVIHELQDRYANLSIVEVRGAVGKGCAVRAGFETGSEPFVGFTDADGSTSAAEFDRIYRGLRDSSADGCIGSRWVPGSTVSPPTSFMRRLASRVFNLLTRALFGLHIADTQSGSKIFRRDSLAPVVDALEQSSWAFDVELLWSLARRGCRILELPIASVDRPGSKIDLGRTSWTMLSSILRLRIQNSPLFRVRFLSRIGADASVPVRSSRTVLVFGSNPVALAKVGAALRAGGFTPVDARAEAAAWQPSLRRFGDGWALRALVFAWYVVKSDRKYDAVVEIEGAKPWFVPALSVKPSVLVGSTTSFPAWARSLYRRCANVDPGAPDVAAAIASLDTRLHKAVFVRDGQANRLHYRDAKSGTVESLTLR